MLEKTKIKMHITVQIILGVLCIFGSIYFNNFNWGQLYQLGIEFGDKYISFSSIVNILHYIIFACGISGIIIPITRYNILKDTIK